ncbi:MAG: glutaredoxin domain-containing protein, partial [Nitrospinota bacterium]
KRGVEFEEHLVFAGTPEWEAMRKRTGGKTVPQVVIDGEVIGGFDRLSALDASGGLAGRVAG